MDLQCLLEAVDQIDLISDQTWQESLNERKRAELEFHDRDRNLELIEQTKANDTYEQFYGNKKYYDTVARSKNFVDQWIAENAKGKVFLDYACGNGRNAIHAARSGAAMSLGLDISGVSVNNAKRFAHDAGVDGNTRFFQADAENTKLPDDCIDVIVCSGMLHHLDLSFAFPELRRILRPGGKILALEALDYNPAIKLYRMLTPDMRTEWEKAHILDLSDVRFAGRFFEVESIRYWHILGYAAGKFPALLIPLDVIDRILERIPLIQRLAWIFTFVLVKPSDSAATPPQ